MAEIVRGCEDTDEEEDIDVSRIGREGESLSLMMMKITCASIATVSLKT